MSRRRREIPDPLVVGRVVRDVIDPFTRSASLRVAYRNKRVTNGADFRPSVVCSRPRAHISDGDLRTLYTLVLVNPDSPNPTDPTDREYLHWLVINIPASTDATFGQEIVAYEAPKPLQGIHRLVFVLFRQMDRLMGPAPERRENFNTRAFAEHNRLGSPVAATFFNCQRERGTGGRRFTYT